jgi:hypothetical protein
MNNAYILIRELVEKDIRLDVRGDKLRVDAPADLLTPELQDRLKSHKQELLSALRDRLFRPEATDIAFEQAVEYFGSKGLRYELEERAAILEYDGGLDRDQAEKRAVEEITERLDRFG